MYYYFAEDIMESGASVPAAVPLKDTEVLMVHQRIKLHGIEETTSGFYLINIHINCALGILLAAFWSAYFFAIWGIGSSIGLERNTKLQHRCPQVLRAQPALL
jgi:hypothetical protein